MHIMNPIITDHHDVADRPSGIQVKLSDITNEINHFGVPPVRPRRIGGVNRITSDSCHLPFESN